MRPGDTEYERQWFELRGLQLVWFEQAGSAKAGGVIPPTPANPPQPSLPSAMQASFWPSRPSPSVATGWIAPQKSGWIVRKSRLRRLCRSA